MKVVLDRQGEYYINGTTNDMVVLESSKLTNKGKRLFGYVDQDRIVHHTWEEDKGNTILSDASGDFYAYNVFYEGTMKIRVRDIRSGDIKLQIEAPENIVIIKVEQDGSVYGGCLPNRVFYATANGGGVNKMAILPTKDNIMSIDTINPTEMKGSEKRIVIMTQLDIFFLTKELDLSHRFKLPPDIQEPPKGLITCDKVDAVWQIRAFDPFLIIITQNNVFVYCLEKNVLVKYPMPSIIDALWIDERDIIALAHMDGRVFLINCITGKVSDTIYKPKKTIWGHKLDDTHCNSRLLSYRSDTINISRFEGVIDSLSFDPL